MTLKFRKHELERIVGHTLRPSDHLSQGDYEKLEAVWRASLKPDTPWKARVRAGRKFIYPEVGRNIIQKAIKYGFRKREGLNLDGSQDPVCYILGPGSHHWESFGGSLRCTECEDIDFNWVPGWCPSGWCGCDPDGRDTGTCSSIVDQQPDIPYEEEEFDIDPLSGLPRASKYDLERCAPRSEGKTSETVWEEDSVWTGAVPRTLKELRELGRDVGVKNASKMNSETLLNLLGIPRGEATLGKPRVSVSIVLTDRESGEVLRFPSLSGASRYLGANPGSVSYHIKTDGRITADGRTYTVVRGVPGTEPET